ncbi:hypothetical protein, partial [Neisseria gonorrhoeae]|uniref:hypothetical protein n=1 Tax=Neisseria gonorrhoeae TaxID=485 RepID=UPI00064C9C56
MICSKKKPPHEEAAKHTRLTQRNQDSGISPAKTGTTAHRQFGCPGIVNAPWEKGSCKPITPIPPLAL